MFYLRFPGLYFSGRKVQTLCDIDRFVLFAFNWSVLFMVDSFCGRLVCRQICTFLVLDCSFVVEIIVLIVLDYTVPKVIDFPRYNMKCSWGNVILRGIVHVVSGFPLHFMFYRGNLDYFSNRVVRCNKMLLINDMFYKT